MRCNNVDPTLNLFFGSLIVFIWLGGALSILYVRMIKSHGVAQHQDWGGEIRAHFRGITVDVWEELVITINSYADEGDGSGSKKATNGTYRNIFRIA